MLPSEEELLGVPEGICRNSMLRGRMTRTVCATGGPIRHAGLGLPAYVQTTSPIRRYADLLAHWQLKVAAPAYKTWSVQQRLSTLLKPLEATCTPDSKLVKFLFLCSLMDHHKYFTFAMAGMARMKDLHAGISAW